MIGSDWNEWYWRRWTGVRTFPSAQPLGKLQFLEALNVHLLLKCHLIHFLMNLGFLTKFFILWRWWWSESCSISALLWHFLYYGAAYPARTSFVLKFRDNWRHNYSNLYNVEGFNCYFTVIYLYFKTKKAITIGNYSEWNVKLPNDLIITFLFPTIFSLSTAKPRTQWSQWQKHPLTAQGAAVCKTFCTVSSRLFSSDHHMTNYSTKGK